MALWLTRSPTGDHTHSHTHTHTHSHTHTHTPNNYNSNPHLHAHAHACTRTLACSRPRRPAASRRIVSARARETTCAVRECCNMLCSCCNMLYSCCSRRRCVACDAQGGGVRRAQLRRRHSGDCGPVRHCSVQHARCSIAARNALPAAWVGRGGCGLLRAQCDTRLACAAHCGPEAPLGRGRVAMEVRPCEPGRCRRSWPARSAWTCGTARRRRP